MMITPTIPAHLIDDLRRQDHTAFRHFAEDCTSFIYRRVYSLTNNSQLADDITQETLLKTFLALPKFEQRSSLCSWIYRIATNTTFMHLRKQKRHPEPEVLLTESCENMPQLPDLVDERCKENPERLLLNSELGQSIAEGVARLSPSLRSVFQYRFVNGLSVAETAATLDVSEGVIKTRSHRMRKALQEHLKVTAG